MQLLTIRRDGEWRVGVLKDSQVAELGSIQGDCHSPLRRLLIAGSDGLKRASDEAETKFASGSHVSLLEELQLGPPVPDPEKILCVGFNYREHAQEMAAEVPIVPNVFAKFRNCLIASGENIVLPTASSQIDYEGELAAIVGRRCYRVSLEDALDYVAGYTVLNDVSARDLQFRTTQWTLGKAIDTFCPMGPVMTTSDEIATPQALDLTTRVNGEVVQQSSCGAMVFSVAQTVVALSALMTLEPGDIISTGTPPGVGWKRKPPRFLAAGDVVEVEISGIGVLRNGIAEYAEYGGAAKGVSATAAAPFQLPESL
jgi:acylpyruvate hydrolase